VCEYYKAGKDNFFLDESREKKHQAVKITGSVDDILLRADPQIRAMKV
jgi:hypothetical protein